MPRLPQDRRLRLAGLLAAVAVLVTGTWLVVGRTDSGSPDATVRDFFEARRAGDCPRLVDLVSEASWPGDDVDASRTERVRRCEDVIDTQAPDLADVETVREEGDDAVASMSLVLGEREDGVPAADLEPGLVVSGPDVADEDTGQLARRAHADGRLRREGGEWRVVLDHRFLRIGRSVEQTVAGFADAHHAGDCEQMLDHLTEATWSRDGTLSHDEYLDRCRERADAVRRTSAELNRDPASVQSVTQVTPADDGSVSARVLWQQWVVETATLRMEDGEWKLDGQLDRIGHVELTSSLAPDAVDGAFTLDQLPSVVAVAPEAEPVTFLALDEGDDAPQRRREHGFVRGVTADYTASTPDAYLDVLVFEFDDPDGARRHAEHLAARTTAFRHPREPVSVSSVDDPRATDVDCDAPPDDCSTSAYMVAIGVRDRFVVAVDLTDHGAGDGLPTAEAQARAAEVLRVQLERLAMT